MMAKKYEVCFRIKGDYVAEVMADNEDEAFNKACNELDSSGVDYEITDSAISVMKEVS